MVTISIDAMGGDFGPPVTIPAVKNALHNHPDLKIILVGLQEILEPLVLSHALPSDRCHIHHASEIVAMDELPSAALRYKKDSSMRVAINLVKEGKAQACVSAGNTGALVGISKFVLHTLGGIHRPAIISALPTMKANPVYMVDLGANVDVDASQLLEFAVMGAVLAEAVEGRVSPRVGLLNVGQEEIKGSQQVKEAATLLKDSALNYIGFVEGDDIFKGEVDVVVCDGFVGNAALKASEGISKLIGLRIKESFKRNLLSKICGLLALPVIRDIKNRLDPSQYNGASLIGLQGIVIKSHGSASVKGFTCAIEEAMIQAKQKVPQLIADKVEAIIKSEKLK